MTALKIIGAILAGVVLILGALIVVSIMIAFDITREEEGRE